MTTRKDWSEHHVASAPATWSAGLTPDQIREARERYDAYCHLLVDERGHEGLVFGGHFSRRTRCHKCNSAVVGLPSFAVDTRHALCPMCVVDTRADKVLLERLNRLYGMDELGGRRLLAGVGAKIGKTGKTGTTGTTRPAVLPGVDPAGVDDDLPWNDT